MNPAAMAMAMRAMSLSQHVMPQKKLFPLAPCVEEQIVLKSCDHKSRQRLSDIVKLLSAESGLQNFPPARIGALQKRVVSRLVVEFCRGRDPSPSADLPRLCELVSVVSKLKLEDEEFAKDVREVEACFSLLANPKPTAAQVNLAAETSTKLLEEKKNMGPSTRL